MNRTARIPRSALAFALAATLPAFVFGATARADVIELRTGRLQGKIIEETEDQLVLQTEVGRVSINRADVVSIHRGMTPRETYEAWLAELKPDDVLGHLALAEYCRQEKLVPEARALFEKILELEPDKERARKALGFVRQGDRWVTEEELQTARGLVHFRGNWVTPEYRDQVLREEAERRLAAQLQPLAYRTARGDASARKEIESLRDPYALRPLTSLLRHDSPAVRLAAATALAAFESPDAAHALAASAITDNDESVRKTCTALLSKRDPLEALALFSSQLASLTARRIVSPDERRQVERHLERLARATGALEHPLAIPLLIRMVRVRLNMVDDSGETPPQAFFVNLSASEELQKLTRERFYDNRQAWLAWWTEHGYDLAGDAWDDSIDRLR